MEREERRERERERLDARRAAENETFDAAGRVSGASLVDVGYEPRLPHLRRGNARERSRIPSTSPRTRLTSRTPFRAVPLDGFAFTPVPPARVSSCWLRRRSPRLGVPRLPPSPSPLSPRRPRRAPPHAPPPPPPLPSRASARSRRNSNHASNARDANRSRNRVAALRRMRRRRCAASSSSTHPRSARLRRERERCRVALASLARRFASSLASASARRERLSLIHI